MTERERTIVMIEEAESYDGPDQSDALWGEIDCRIELLILDKLIIDTHGH